MDCALKITSLKKTYKNGVAALKGIDLEVKKGDFFALLGPNGAGKTTAIGIVTSLVNKTEGKVSVFGHDLDKDPEEAKRSVGVVPQEVNFSIFENVEDIVVQQAGYYGIPRKEAKKRAEHYLKKLELWEKRNSSAKALSGGMKRRLMIARALVHDPKLLILDEPTAGVDIEIRRSMWEFLKELNANGKTIILTTHYLEEAENLCKNVAIIDKGEIVENTSMKKLLSKSDKETFIFDVASKKEGLSSLVGFKMKWVDDHSIEVECDKKSSLNSLFSHFEKEGVVVRSMRNKSNRLEELFLSVVKK